MFACIDIWKALNRVNLKGGEIKERRKSCSIHKQLVWCIHPLTPYPHPPPNQIKFLARKVKQRHQGYQKSDPGGICVWFSCVCVCLRVKCLFLLRFVQVCKQCSRLTLSPVVCSLVCEPHRLGCTRENSVKSWTESVSQVKERIQCQIMNRKCLSVQCKIMNREC